MGGWAAAGPGLGSGIASASPRPAPVDTVTAFADVTGSGTVLGWDPTTVAAWKSAGVGVGPAGGAKAVLSGAGAELPITSGYVESHSDHSFKPGFVLGSIEQFGSGLTFASAATSVAAINLVFDLGESMVYGTIGSTEDIPLFSLQRAHLQVSRSGRTMRIAGVQLDLTPTGAAELDALFHTAAITPYTEIATAQITVTGKVSRYTFSEQTAEYPRLSGTSFSVTFSEPGLEVFRRVGVKPSSTGSASYDPDSGKLSFPVTGGTAVVHPDRHGLPTSISGVVLSQGSGLVLTQGSRSVTMTELTWVPATSTVYASVNGGPDNGALFSVKGLRSHISLGDGNLNVRGASFALAAGGAVMLNSVFKTSDFRVGAQLGKFTLVASGG